MVNVEKDVYYFRDDFVLKTKIHQTVVGIEGRDVETELFGPDSGIPRQFDTVNIETDTVAQRMKMELGL